MDKPTALREAEACVRVFHGSVKTTAEDWAVKMARHVIELLTEINEIEKKSTLDKISLSENKLTKGKVKAYAAN